MEKTKMEMKRIQNPSRRHVTFSKRKNGLVKKHSSFLFSVMLKLLLSFSLKLERSASLQAMTSKLPSFLAPFSILSALKSVYL